MFKTTPRSTLMGGDLIQKSAMRLRINEDGTLERYTDNLTEEDLAKNGGGVPNPYGEGMVDRAPTGSGPGHYHMIDALLEALLRLSERNGFEKTDEMKNQYINFIDHMIHSRNQKIIKIEGENSPNIMSGFRSKRWRTLHGSDHISEKEAKAIMATGRLLPTVKHSRHGGVQIQNADGSISDAGHQVSHFTKKGTIDDPNADQGNSIDSIYNPINVEIGETLQMAAPWLKKSMGIPEGEIGPLDNFQAFNPIKRMTRNHILPLSEVSSGMVHTLTEKEMNQMKQNIIPQRVLRRYKDHQGQGYVPAEQHDSEFDVTHSGAPVPKYALEAHSQEGRTRGEGSYDRVVAMQQFLQSIEGMAHVSPESKQKAIDLLAREESEGALRANVLSPKMSALFGIGTRRQGEKDTRTKVSNKVKGGVDNQNFQNYIAQLGLTDREVRAALMSMSVENPVKDTTAANASEIGHAFHAANLALINKLIREGHPEPHIESANRIRDIGQLKNPGNAQQVADAQTMVDLYNEAYEHRLSYQGGNQMPANNMDWFYRGQDTPASGTLADLYGGMDIERIRTSFETLQMMSAIKDDRVMKYVKKGRSLKSYNDIRSFATSVGLTSQDVYGIMATKGDWDVLAKQWNVSPLIVKATKVTFGGA
tara:strand:+ start:1957 stop:3900 length:1944 start_codon:yes stop_codon:yes gene_type:complete